MPVTMRDVAARAGVSPVVVSRVLHNRALSIRVSEATASRVREAAKDLGYRCNVFARHFRAQHTFTIGVLHGVGFARPYFAKGSHYFSTLMDGLVEGAFNHGYAVTLCPKLLGERPETAIDDGRFDGLVWYCPSVSYQCRDMLLQASVPVVVVHTPAVEFENHFPSVICDNDQGIRLAVEHLVDLGHRRIGFVHEGYVHNPEMEARKRAFVRHMAAQGLDACPGDLLDVGEDCSNVDSLLSARSHTALIAPMDDLAAALMDRSQVLGIEVPRDLSVVGFDSTSFCEELRPRLTSVFQPLAIMGERAIGMLVQAIKQEPIDSLQLIVPCGLDVRESTTSLSPTEK